MQAYPENNNRAVTKPSRRAMPFALAIGALIQLWIVPASASTVSYFLDQSNRLTGGTGYLKVSIDNEGAVGAINFNVEILPALSALGTGHFGIQAFGFNGIELNKSSIVGLPDHWGLKHDKKMDGFGKYENVLVGKFQDRRDLLTFSIVGIAADDLGSYAASHDGGDGLFFAAYVGGISPIGKHKDCISCSRMAYFGGGAGGTPVPVPTAIPVPAAAWLFGSGLLALLGAVRRKQRPVIN